MEEKKKIILLGGGGHAKVLIELIRRSEDYEIIGILNPKDEAGPLVDGIAVLGDDALIPGLIDNGIKNACIAVGSIKDNSLRRKLFESVKKAGLYIPYMIHPKAVVLESGTNIAEGVQIMAGAIVQIGSTFAENTIVNTGALIEHDCVIGKNVHICPGVVICGGSKVGDNSFIGAGATVIQGIEIGRNVVVGAGSVVLENVKDGARVTGAPAK